MPDATKAAAKPAKIIDIERIDKHLRGTVADITRLRKLQSQSWAERRADELEDLKDMLNELRRDRLMRGPDGKRIDR